MMRKAFAALDHRLDSPMRLVVGGGAAMVLAYGHTLDTQDVDAYPARGGLSLAEVDREAREVANELGIRPDWLNAHFQTFTHVLAQDYASRLVNVFVGRMLRVDALGAEDLLVMKCFAGRDKDLPHARKLLRRARDLAIVERRLADLVEKRIPGADAAADYFDDLRDEAGV